MIEKKRPISIPDVDMNDDPLFSVTASDDILITDNIEQLQVTTAKIRQRKKEDIEFQKPIISHYDEGVIYPNTLNLIQGPAGAHKSRLAEIICAIILSGLRGAKNFLNFHLSGFNNFCLCYIDTERNTNDQFPFALQKIQVLAGYGKEEDPPNFNFSSFIEFKRDKRQQLLEAYVQSIRSTVAGDLFIVLDVITDFVGDFNRTGESLELIDWMNSLVNQYNITFLVIIHENPGSEKARGHVGTELLNKVSTAIQIAPDKTVEDLDVYKVKFLKCRNSKKPDPFYVRYSADVKSLIKVDVEEVELFKANNSTKAPIPEIVKELSVIMPDQILSKKMLLASLRLKFEASDKTLMERIDGIVDNKIPVMAEQNVVYYLRKLSKGREVQFELQPQ